MQWSPDGLQYFTFFLSWGLWSSAQQCEYRFKVSTAFEAFVDWPMST